MITILVGTFMCLFLLRDLLLGRVNGILKTSALIR
jgi:hypothetical protein